MCVVCELKASIYGVLHYLQVGGMNTELNYRTRELVSVRKAPDMFWWPEVKYWELSVNREKRKKKTVGLSCYTEWQEEKVGEEVSLRVQCI